MNVFKISFKAQPCFGLAFWSKETNVYKWDKDDIPENLASAIEKDDFPVFYETHIILPFCVITIKKTSLPDSWDEE